MSECQNKSFSQNKTKEKTKSGTEGISINDFELSKCFQINFFILFFFCDNDNKSDKNELKIKRYDFSAF